MAQFNLAYTSNNFILFVLLSFFQLDLNIFSNFHELLFVPDSHLGGVLPLLQDLVGPGQTFEKLTEFLLVIDTLRLHFKVFN